MGCFCKPKEEKGAVSGRLISTTRLSGSGPRVVPDAAAAHCSAPSPARHPRSEPFEPLRLLGQAGYSLPTRLRPWLAIAEYDSQVRHVFNFQTVFAVNRCSKRVGRGEKKRYPAAAEPWVWP